MEAGQSIIGRDAWGAAPPREAFEARGDLRAVVVHHTGVPASSVHVGAEACYVRTLQRRHVGRGWSDIGYHLVVLPSGRVYQGRPLEALGAHVLSHNRGTLGVGVAGDFKFERPTAPALEALLGILDRVGHGVPVVGHCDLARTSCPGRFLYRRLKDAVAASQRRAQAEQPALRMVGASRV